jgi:hypothetical protein
MSHTIYAAFKITNQSVVKDAQLVPIIILNFWCKHGHQSKEMYRQLNIQPMNSRALEGQAVPDSLMAPIMLLFP